MSDSPTPERETLSAALKAAQHVDWMTVVLNGGPPCFAIIDQDGGGFCLRAHRWAGHGEGRWPMHAYVSLADLLAKVQQEGAQEERQRHRRSFFEIVDAVHGEEPTR